jgi:signal transduction histidine kinase
MVQATWDHIFQLDVRSGPDLPFVKCDPLALQNAVFNLLLNARDAMPNGGTISVHANRTLLGPDVPGVEIRVIDTGIGMKPDTVDRAFDPFFTTKSDGLGGVGLPMVERFAHDSGGHVFIESEYGIGTAVILRLPAAPTSADLQQAAPRR